MPTTSKPKLYNPRHPERKLRYQAVPEHYETWLDLASAGQFDGQGDHHSPKSYVRKAFEKYLECGIFAHGFARSRCGDCGHDFLVAFSCKGRGVCPSCNTRRMAKRRLAWSGCPKRAASWSTLRSLANIDKNASTSATPISRG